MKTCKKCQITKPFDCFYTKSTNADGFQHQCKDCVKLRSSVWYHTNIEKGKEARKAWREANKEKVSEYLHEWRKNNPEKLKEGCAAWRKANKDRVAANAQAWRESHPGAITAYSAKRYASKTQATPGWANTKNIAVFYEFARLLSEWTGEPFHVDHIVPLRSKKVCGLHWEGNLRVIEGKDNLAKSNSFWPDMP